MATFENRLGQYLEEVDLLKSNSTLVLSTFEIRDK